MYIWNDQLQTSSSMETSFAFLFCNSRKSNEQRDWLLEQTPSFWKLIFDPLILLLLCFFFVPSLQNSFRSSCVGRKNLEFFSCWSWSWRKETVKFCCCCRRSIDFPKVPSPEFDETNLISIWWSVSLSSNDCKQPSWNRFSCHAESGAISENSTLKSGFRQSGWYKLVATPVAIFVEDDDCKLKRSELGCSNPCIWFSSWWKVEFVEEEKSE